MKLWYTSINLNLKFNVISKLNFFLTFLWSNFLIICIFCLTVYPPPRQELIKIKLSENHRTNITQNQENILIKIHKIIRYQKVHHPSFKVNGLVSFSHSLKWINKLMSSKKYQRKIQVISLNNMKMRETFSLSFVLFRKNLRNKSLVKTISSKWKFL